MLFRSLYRGPGKAIVAWNSALISDMIYNQPVFYEFENLKIPVLLIIGDKDNTAPGKQLAPPEIRGQLGNYPALAEAAVKRFKQGKLIRFADLGHSPQIQDPARFHAALLEVLYASGSDLLILPIQDAFNWRDRINQPATIGPANWTWRLPWPVERLRTQPEGVAVARGLRSWAERHHRLP